MSSDTVPVSQASWEAACRETERLSRHLDITNADHIALWLETNMDDASLAWLACRIVEAHEAATPTPSPAMPSREEIARAAVEHAKRYDTPKADDLRRRFTVAQMDIAISHALALTSVDRASEADKLREAHRTSHCFSSGHGPDGDFTTLVFRNSADRQAFNDAHIAMCRARAALSDGSKAE
jgi:hypothetical protein